MRQLVKGLRGVPLILRFPVKRMSFVRQSALRPPDPLRRMKRAGRIAVVHGFLTLVLFPFLFVFQSRATDNEDYTQVLCVIFTVAALWLLVSCYFVCREVYHPYSLFLASAIMFNGGQLFLVGTGFLSPRLLMFGQFSPSTVNFTIYLIFSSLLMLHLGVLVYLATHRNSAPCRPDHDRSIVAIRKAGFGLMTIGALPFIGVIVHDLSVSAQGYEGLYSTDIGIGAAGRGVLANLFLPGLISAVAGSTKKGLAVKLLLSFAVIDIGLLLVLGSRSQALTLGCALIFVWSRCISRIPKLVSIGLIAGFVVVAPTVAVLRNLPVAERLSASQALSTLSDEKNVGFAMLSETGMTIETTALTVDLVPQSRPYDLGLSYVNAILFSLPGTGYLINSAKDPVILSVWLIRQVDSAVAERGGGLGFSFIAEAYLNFGTIFGPVMCAGIGLLIACLVFRTDDRLSVAFSGCLLLSLPLFARGESLLISRGLLWQCFLPMLVARYLIYRERLVDKLRLRSKPLIPSQQYQSRPQPE